MCERPSDSPLAGHVLDVLAAAVEWKVRGDEPSAVALMAAVTRYRDAVAVARYWTVPNA